MTDPAPRSLTHLLQAARAGEPGASAAVAKLAYAELAGLARIHFGPQRAGHTLQPTVLVHEAWLKLSAHLGRVADRQHFFAIASRAMRQVLADYARSNERQKRGGKNARVTLDPDLVGSDDPGVALVDLDDSLSRLAQLNARHARLVELRFFGGLTIAEAATELEVSHGTVERDWKMARAWLHNELGCAG